MKINERTRCAFDSHKKQTINIMRRPAPPSLGISTQSIRVDALGKPSYEEAPPGEEGRILGEWTEKGFQYYPSSKRRSLQQRSNPLTEIETAEGGPVSGNDNPTETLTADFQIYLNTFNSLQANITALIIPALTPLVQSTNDSMVLDIAWSIYTQLTGSSVVVAGPYMYGMHCFDALEAQYFKAHNISSNVTTFDTQTQLYLAYHYELIETYTAAWANATLAVNGTGMLEGMSLLFKYLTPQDSSVAYDGYYTQPSMSYDDSFFKTFGITPVHKGTNGTAS